MLTAKYFKAGFANKILLLLLVFSPVNSKIAGACWLLFFILGARSFKLGKHQGNTTAYSATKIWLMACLLALAFRSAPQFYWGDSWQERHAEFRLLIGAIGLVGMANYFRLTIHESRWLGYGVILAIWFGFFWIIFLGWEHTPTNRIPWGASMAFLVCLALPFVFDSTPISLLKRLFYVSGVIAGVYAVFLSQARGAYGIVLWIGIVFLWHAVKVGFNWRQFTAGMLIVVSFSSLLVIIFPDIATIPIQRIELAAAELAHSASTTADAADSSVGARVYMWKRAVEEIPDNLLFGVGRDARIAAIQRWGSEANAPIVVRLRHLHNDYLQSLFDHGLFALFSFLTLIAGIFLMIFRLQKENPLASLGLAGILFTHASTSLTNMNFAHNYYPTMLSISISLCFFLYNFKEK